MAKLKCGPALLFSALLCAFHTLPAQAEKNLSGVWSGTYAEDWPDRFPGPDCIEKREAAFARQWFDQPCFNTRAFVCEKAAAPAP